MKTPFPVVPLSLVQELEKRFPDTIPLDPQILGNPVKMGELAGTQVVVRLLRREFEKQNTPSKD